MRCGERLDDAPPASQGDDNSAEPAAVTLSRCPPQEPHGTPAFRRMAPLKLPVRRIQPSPACLCFRV
ncbi:hypothetical protein NDU88_008688 [Pleurodeles waltl]|uniref:Uncharacterized protein n=1 Tax=Pleurodeles waltl TaxID=8319 RepID=A0AAV7PQI9_PLEWA|nr:hypothetical protein NDU88_008688 [Pleurodeles waltl]